MVLLPFLIPDKFYRAQFAADHLKILTGMQSEVLATGLLRFAVKILFFFKPIFQEAFQRLHHFAFLFPQKKVFRRA